jgi:hypothetical protein
MQSSPDMNPYVSYAEIPTAERKRLGAEAYRQTPSLRLRMFVITFLSISVSSLLFDEFVPRSGPLGFFPRLGLKVASALLLYTLIWEIFGRRLLRTTVEKLKNSP